MAERDYYLKLDGIPGESKDKNHKDEIELESWNWGVNAGVDAATKQRTGRSTLNDLNFTMRVNKASPELFLKCANGAKIKTADLTCLKAGDDGKQATYFKISLTDVYVTTYNTGGSSSEHSTTLTESYSLAFTKIELAYTPKGASPVVKSFSIAEHAGS